MIYSKVKIKQKNKYKKAIINLKRNNLIKEYYLLKLIQLIIKNKLKFTIINIINKL